VSRAVSPASVSVRDGEASDYAVYVRLFPELHVPDPRLSAVQFEERMLPSLVIAEDGGRAAGYAHWRFYGTTLHVVHVVSAPASRGRGVGKAMMEEVRRRVSSGDRRGPSRSIHRARTACG